MQQCRGESREQQCNSAVRRVGSSSATVQWESKEQQCNSKVGRVGSSSATVQ